MLKNFATYQTAVQFYKQCQRLQAPWHLYDQLQRAASSVVLNLAEGTERGSRADQRRYFRMAMGCARECQAIIDLLDESQAVLETKKRGDHLAALLFKLIQSVEKNPYFNGNRGQRTENGEL